MTHFRPFRNADTPALTALWNRGTPGRAVAAPLRVDEFEARVVGGPLFEAAGLIVAERDGTPVGFAHAGFGPEDGARPLRLSYELGTVGMLVAEPGSDDPAVESGLLAEAERYLRARGATVVYAGGRLPLNPFYWGLYGGSEWAGVLGSHEAFHRAVRVAGFQAVGSTVLLEVDPARPPETRDPRAVLLRRQARFEVDEDAFPSGWWEALALGDFRPTTYRLVAKTGGAVIARAGSWDMAWFGRRDGRARLGLYDVGVHADHRRKGFGRHLVAEILRLASAQATAVVSVQTASTNVAALALYKAVGFEPVETATLYRLPGGSAVRSK